MLKIKDNITFEYLEKNYEELKRRMWNDISYGLYRNGLEIYGNKRIGILNSSGENFLFDLIKADLVEKASDQMKSLEIVNISLEELLNKKTEICEYDLLKIKQDLEVLEILRKHLVLFYNCFGKEKLDYYEIRCIRLDDYNKANEEYFNKVKQWLEENE